VLGVEHGEEQREHLRVMEEVHGGRFLGMLADVTNEEGVEAVRAEAQELFGNPEILVNLVGGFTHGQMLWELDVAAWDHMMALNLRSAFLCCRALIPGMIKEGYGRIVNMASKRATAIRPGAAVYSISKAAVVTLTQALREELKGTGVTVAAVTPSAIDSEAARKSMPKADPSKWVSPDDLAKGIAYLCSEDGGLFSGGILPAYGGQ